MFKEIHQVTTSAPLASVEDDEPQGNAFKRPGTATAAVCDFRAPRKGRFSFFNHQNAWPSPFRYKFLHLVLFLWKSPAKWVIVRPLERFATPPPVRGQLCRKAGLRPAPAALSPPRPG